MATADDILTLNSAKRMFADHIAGILKCTDVRSANCSSKISKEVQQAWNFINGADYAYTAEDYDKFGELANAAHLILENTLITC